MTRAWVWMSVAGLAACGGAKSGSNDANRDARSTPPAGAPAAPPAASAGGATISGTVKFTGAPPKNPTIDMSEEPACKGKYSTPPTNPVVSVNNGMLENVFIYVKSGLPANAPKTSPQSAALLDQRGCLYHPRVMGVMVGQPIEIQNSDPVLHNIKSVPKTNRGFNISQPTEGMKTSRNFSAAEPAIPIECSVHSWMHGRVFVMDNPFFAVTGPDGSFTIKGLPEGTYTLEAWHEKLGTKTGSVTVTTDGTATTSFTFGG